MWAAGDREASKTSRSALAACGGMGAWPPQASRIRPEDGHGSESGGGAGHPVAKGVSDQDGRLVRAQGLNHLGDVDGEVRQGAAIGSRACPNPLGLMAAVL